MRAVWSFWSVPYAASTGLRWKSERYHLFAWVLSLLEARRHYPRTALVTDTPGKVLLVERLSSALRRRPPAAPSAAARPGAPPGRCRGRGPLHQAVPASPG